jgi:ABC-type uncharacterized transport system permease subunit
MIGANCKWDLFVARTDLQAKSSPDGYGINYFEWYKVSEDKFAPALIKYLYEQTFPPNPNFEVEVQFFKDFDGNIVGVAERYSILEPGPPTYVKGYRLNCGVVSSVAKNPLTIFALVAVAGIAGVMAWRLVKK